MTDGVSVLAAMTGAVVVAAPKAAPKVRLTALPGEAVGPSILTPVAVPIPATPAAFPNDQPTEVVAGILVALELQRDHLNEVIAGLRLLLGDPEVTEAQIAKDAATTQALIEREADRRVADAAEAAEPAPDKKDKAATARRTATVARVAEAEANPLEAVVLAAEAKDRKRAIQLAALADATVDESFQARMARLSQEAQEHAFTPVPAEVPGTALPNQVEDAEGWRCPFHGTVTTKTSARRNRDYQACPEPGCSQFERL